MHAASYKHDPKAGMTNQVTATLLAQLAQGKKFLAEYVDDKPKCGVWDDITAGKPGSLSVQARSLTPAVKRNGLTVPHTTHASLVACLVMYILSTLVPHMHCR